LHLPKNWLHGAVKLTENEQKWCKNKGWQFIILDKPSINKRNNIVIGHEILEFQEKPDVFQDFERK
jgi:hypothetical protein